MRSILSLFLGGSLLLTSCTIDPAIKDAEYIVSAVERNYPYLVIYERNQGQSWVSSAKRKISHWKDGDYADRVDLFEDILLGLNGHVGLVRGSQFPFIHDGYTRRAPTNPKLRAWADTLSKPEVRSAYHFEPSPVSGEPVGPVESGPAEITLAANKDFLLVRIPSFQADLVEPDRIELFRFLENHAKPDLPIVIDIRGNGGGSDNYWRDLLVAPLVESEFTLATNVVYRGGAESMPYLASRKIELHPYITSEQRFPLAERSSEFRFFSTEQLTVKPGSHHFPHGRIIVLMDSRNFSASETFVSFAKSTHWATLVGQRSSGDGIGFDPIYVELPESHFLVRLPISAALNPDGTFNAETGTEPDILLGTSTDSLEYVKDHILTSSST